MWSDVEEFDQKIFTIKIKKKDGSEILENLVNARSRKFK